MLGHRGGEHGSVLIAEQGFGAAGSDVDAEQIGHGRRSPELRVNERPYFAGDGEGSKGQVSIVRRVNHSNT